MKTTLLALFALASCAFAQESLPPTPKDLEEFVVSTLPYQVGERFHKWNAPPRISLCDRAVEYRPFAEKFVADVSAILQGLPTAPILVEDNLPTSDVVLVIADAKTLVERKRRDHTPTNYQWLATWNGDQSIRHFTVYLDGSQFKNPNDLNERRIIYAALLKALGINGDHAQKIISIWGQFNEGTPQDALWENDKKLVRFAYQFVPSNASKTDVRALFKKNWR